MSAFIHLSLIESVLSSNDEAMQLISYPRSYSLIYFLNSLFLSSALLYFFDIILFVTSLLQFFFTLITDTLIIAVLHPYQKVYQTIFASPLSLFHYFYFATRVLLTYFKYLGIFIVFSISNTSYFY